MRATGTYNALPEAVWGTGFAPPRFASPRFASPRFASPPPARASDADRERTVALLREHWLAGRLTLSELEARSEEAWSARLVAELWSSVRELPVPVLCAPPPAPKRRGSTGVVSFVLGIIGTCLLLLSFGMLFFLALPLTAGAWMSGRHARRRTTVGGPGLALAGETLGIVGTILACLALASCAAMLA